MYFFDAHCDSPSQMLRLRDFSKDNDHAQVDFPKMLRGEVLASFFALYVPSRLGTEEAWEYMCKLHAALQAQINANSSIVGYAGSVKEAVHNSEKGLISLFMGLENGSPIGKDMSRVDALFRKGIRYITLTHSMDNQICDSCTGTGTWQGLSAFGEELVGKMNESGMIVDVAHSSDLTIRRVLEISESPILFTHGCCRALSAHRRNLPDDLLRSIADKGGVNCISVFPCFLDEGFVKTLDASKLEEKMWVEDEFNADPSNPVKRKAWNELQDELLRLPRPGVSRVVDHIDHAVNVAGVEAVGIGTDYDGIEVTPQGMESIDKMPEIIAEMKRRGYGEGDIEKITHGNLLRSIADIQRSV